MTDKTPDVESLIEWLEGEVNEAPMHAAQYQHSQLRKCLETIRQLQAADKSTDDARKRLIDAMGELSYEVDACVAMSGAAIRINRLTAKIETLRAQLAEAMKALEYYELSEHFVDRSNARDALDRINEIGGE